MIALACLVALVAVPLLCMATARHSNLLTDRPRDHAGRVTMRRIGLSLLALSFALLLPSDDLARDIVTWTVALTVMALATALTATLRDKKPKRPRRA